MSILQHLSALAVPALLKGTCQALGFEIGENIADKAVGFFSNHFTDHSQQVTEALRTANDRAWKALEVALAGDSWWDKAKGLLVRGEERALAEPIRQFLQTATFPVLKDQPKIRQRCLLELRAAQKKKLLTRGNLDPQALFQQGAALIRFEDPKKMINAQLQLLEAVAAELDSSGCKGLAWLLRQRPTQGSPLLILLVRYFFRREVETNEELFRGLVWDKLDRLNQNQESAFSAVAEILTRHTERLEALLTDIKEVVVQTRDNVLDLKAELQRQGQQMQELGQAVQKALEQYQLDRRAVSSRDSLSLRSDAERQLVKNVVARYRTLPSAQQQQTPALLNAIGKLEVLAGDFDAAQQDFQKVTTLVADPKAQAEAHHNAYIAALEQRDWNAALRELVLAVKLDPARFAPFPMDKYTPQRILGAGGFGVAFLCKHQYMNAPVVVKALQSDGLERSAEQVFAEAHALRQLDHPGIIRVQDCAFADAEGKARPYLVMDYFEGQTLEELVNRHGPLSVEDLLVFAPQVAAALERAHAAGILHRDVKPANLLVRHEENAGIESWPVKLIDFGLALHQRSLASTMHGRGSRQQTLIGGSIAGTLNYAAPEQMSQTPGVKVGPYSDIYGLAKTCCYALFQTTQPLPKHWRSLPPALADLLEQCLEEDPRKRPQDCGVILRLLKAAASAPGAALASDFDLADDDSEVKPGEPALDVVPVVPPRAATAVRVHPVAVAVPVPAPPVYTEPPEPSGSRLTQRERRARFLHALRQLVRYHNDVRRAGGVRASCSLLLYTLPCIGVIVVLEYIVFGTVASIVLATFFLLIIAARVQRGRMNAARKRWNQAISRIEEEYPEEVNRWGGPEVLNEVVATQQLIQSLESVVD